MNKKELTVIIQTIIALSILFIGIRQLFFYNVVINGSSMEPTLENHQKIYVKKNKTTNYKRNDIIVFQNPESTKKDLYIKRIIGKPGDKIIFKNNNIYVNKKKINENYIKDTFYDDDSPWITSEYGIKKTDEKDATLKNAKEIPEGYYLVLGDNRNHSKDSRSFGYIKESSIITKIN